MKKEWVLFLTSGVVSLGVALVLIRWLAPGLLGVPLDLQLVQVEKKVPPFFEGIFRPEDYASEKFILQDPITSVRAHPFFPDMVTDGPTDLLGFRNRQVPNIADLIVIGDSQTYGNNVPMDFNWPNQTRKSLPHKELMIYNMSVGGWGAIQYYYIFKYAKIFQPRVVVVAFYTGNDSMESFTLAYGSDIWKEFRLNQKLTKSDAPTVAFPPPAEEHWAVTFQDGIKTVFTPKFRLASNENTPAVRAGYEILAKVAEKISLEAAAEGIPIVFTIIPTKELVYAERINTEKIAAPKEYIDLVTNEEKNIQWLAQRIAGLPDAKYVDVLKPLQDKARSTTLLYQENINGHPIYEGYLVIGNAIARHIESAIPQVQTGLVYRNVIGSKPDYFLVKEKRFWFFSSLETAQANGWDLGKKHQAVTVRDMAGYEYMGVINEIDPARFGPSP